RLAAHPSHRLVVLRPPARPEPGPMTHGLRWTTAAAAGALSLGVLALGGAWLADRAHPWDTPGLRPRAFVRLQRATRAADGGAAVTERSGPRDRWVVAVNPRCGHCMATLRRLHQTWSQRAWKPELVTLIVDTTGRPEAGDLVRIPTAQIWWDAR